MFIIFSIVVGQQKIRTIARVDDIIAIRANVDERNVEVKGAVIFLRGLDEPSVTWESFDEMIARLRMVTILKGESQ